MTRRQAFAGAAICIVAATLAVAGCGGDEGVGVGTESVRGFEEEVRAVRESVEDSLADLTDARSREELAERLRGGTQQLRDAADRLEVAEAPEGLEEAKANLAGAVDELAAVFDQSTLDIEQGDWAGVAAALRASAALEEVRAAFDELRRQGVDVDELEGEATRDELEAEIRAARDEAEDALRDVADAGSLDELADRMPEAADRLRDAAERVDEFEADADVRPAKDDFVAALRSLAADLEQAAPAVGEGDLRDALGALDDADLSALRESLRELREAGIDVPDVEAP